MILSAAKLSDKHKTKLIEKYPDETFYFYKNMDEAKQHLAKAEILLTYGEDLTTDLISKAEKLKWIMVISAGMDQMPFEAIHEKGILVTNAKGIHKHPMAEYAIFSLLQVYRQGKQLIQNEAQNKWDRSVRMNEITGKTMLIAGTGAIGQEVARLAKAFQMKTYGISRSGKRVEYFDYNLVNESMVEVLPEADFIVSVLPSTSETKDFFTFEHFQMMPYHAVFLNMGRGDAVRGDDILKAVREEEIAHAVLDVFETEPLPENHPLWEEENVTVTPHLSGISPHYQTRALEIFETNLQVYKENSNNYVNKIDVTRGY
ncbi:D-2-hydroxyacid dehydrogenase [Virgibacillus litoralis]|uniref:Phosphoglycerate dehydrogenase-like enzyme n=1 Tax=Virgibacillus litoralis TaxID=578221 RepID=A0ABS4HB16_9BACI|nr:phosphoglycerate dehydrogenase-like enzyme [Virgibacillus litoralis]